MENPVSERFASELLAEVKQQSRRWFIAFISMVVLEAVTVAWFTLPIEEENISKEVSLDGGGGDTTYYDGNEIGGDLYNGKDNREDYKDSETPSVVSP